MSDPRRVFITGYGSVNCLRSDEGFASLAPPAAPDAAELPQTRPIAEAATEGQVDDRIARRMDRFTLLAYIAVKKAMQHAGVDMAVLPPDRVGLITNTCYGPLDSTRRYISKLIRDGAKKVPAAVFPNTVHNAFTGQITMELKAHGTNSTVSGHNPIAYGLDMIREGRDDLMIVGGCDELLTAMDRSFAHLGLFTGPRANATEAMGGFGSDLNAFVLGEGAAMLVMESEASMRARGATPIAEVLDYGMSNGLAATPGAAFSADAASLVAAMQNALRASHLQADEVDYVSAACNGLPRLARAEIQALDQVFGKGERPLVGNVKAMLGETLGAASSFSAMLAVDVLKQGSAPPVSGLVPGAQPQRIVSGVARSGRFERALVNSIELGGTVTSVLFARAA